MFLNFINLFKIIFSKKLSLCNSRNVSIQGNNKRGVSIIISNSCEKNCLNILITFSRWKPRFDGKSQPNFQNHFEYNYVGVPFVIGIRFIWKITWLRICLSMCVFLNISDQNSICWMYHFNSWLWNSSIVLISE